MRTTIDLPDRLYREIKARAALRGIKLKDLVTEALRDSIARPQPATDEASELLATNAEQVLVLREDCVFPLITGRTGPEMPKLSGKRIDEILEQEDIEIALGPR